MVSAAQNYAPYGAPFGTVGTFASPYAYTGEYTDPSGQVYLRARYYNPAIGTFTALDPVMGVAAVPMSLNGYSYVHNNPVNWTDPSGEFLPVIAVIGLGILGGAVGGALLGGGIEAGSQLLNNGFDLGCLDMDSVGRAALEGAALGALAGGVGAAVGAAGLSGAAAFAVSEGADFIGGFLYDIGVNGMSREEALINGLMGIGFGGAIGLLGRGLSRAARNVNLPLPRQLRRQCASFSADTLIATPDGDKPISEIEVGDVILAYSEATEEVDIYHVSATHTQRHDTTLDITIDGETLHTTDEHPFYVVRDNQEQWVEAQDLHIGDAILSALGETGIVEDIIIIDQPQMMYNLTVALVATYMVGDGQWLVHNVNYCPMPDPGEAFHGFSRLNIRAIEQAMRDLEARIGGQYLLGLRTRAPGAAALDGVVRNKPSGAKTVEKFNDGTRIIRVPEVDPAGIATGNQIKMKGISDADVGFAARHVGDDLFESIPDDEFIDMIVEFGIPRPRPTRVADQSTYLANAINARNGNPGGLIMHGSLVSGLVRGVPLKTEDVQEMFLLEEWYVWSSAGLIDVGQGGHLTQRWLPGDYNILAPQFNLNMPSEGIIKLLKG